MIDAFIAQNSFPQRVVQRIERQGGQSCDRWRDIKNIPPGFDSMYDVPYLKGAMYEALELEFSNRGLSMSHHSSVANVSSMQLETLSECSMSENGTKGKHGTAANLWRLLLYSLSPLCLIKCEGYFYTVFFQS